MSKLSNLRKYVETGTAEGDDSFLRDAFVTWTQYLEIVSVPTGGPRIVLGNKGSGKSALLRYFNSEMQELGIPCLLIRPMDMPLFEGDDNSLGGITRTYQSVMLNTIAIKLSEGIKGLVLNSDDLKLLEVAKKNSERGDDFIEKMFKLLSPLGKKLGDIDFSILNKTAYTTDSLKKAIESSLGKNKQFFYILIDDTDQVAAPNEKNHLNRIWAFLLAARVIMERCPNIKFIISLRDEIWRRLNRDDAGQRDQVDHFRNLIIKINLSDDDIVSVIEKRIELANKEEEYKVDFFQETTVKIPTTDETRSWNDFIVKRSRGRPRDAIQLIFKLVDYAQQNNRNLIEQNSVEKVMPIYSEERVDDLKRECDQECPPIKEIVRAFSDADYSAGSFTLEPQETANFLNTLTSKFSINLMGKVLQNDNREHVFLLWKYLYEIGFLNARTSDTRQDRKFKHITINDEPDLVSLARWNDMQALTWEIHPSYRDYLIKIKSEKEFSFGKPKKSRNKRRNR